MRNVEIGYTQQVNACIWLTEQVTQSEEDGLTVGLFTHTVWPMVPAQVMQEGDVNFFEKPVPEGVVIDEYVLILAPNEPDPFDLKELSPARIVGVERVNKNGPVFDEMRKAVRSARISTGFSWGGSVFQTRDKDLTLISGRATKILAKRSLGESLPDFYWRTEDNSVYLFSADEFLRFAIAVDEFVEQKYIESW